MVNQEKESLIDGAMLSTLNCAISDIESLVGDNSTMIVAMYFVGGLVSDNSFQFEYTRNGVANAYMLTFCGNIQNSQALKIIVEQISQCVGKFGCADKQSVLCSLLDRVKNQKDVDIAEEIIDKCVGVYSTSNEKVRNYCVTEFKKFVVLSELQKQTNRFNKSIKDSDFDTSLKEYTNGIIKAIGNYKTKECNDNEFDLSFIEENEEQNIISWGVPSIDEWCGGGIRKGGICILSAPSGYGKSNWAVAVSEYNVRHNKRVLHISLEMPKKTIVQRYFTRMSGVPYDLVQSFIKYDRNKANKVYNEFVDYQRNGKLSMLNGVYSASDIRLYMEQQRACGIEYDLVVLDYFDRLLSENNYESSKYDKGGAMDILERLAEDFNVALLTFSQMTSEYQNGSKKGVGKQMSGDVGKIYKATMCVTFDKSEKDGNITWQLTCTKSRYTTQITTPIIFNHDGGTCRFYDYDKQFHQDYPNKKEESLLIAELIDFKRYKKTNKSELEIPNANEAMNGIQDNDKAPWE